MAISVDINTTSKVTVKLNPDGKAVVLNEDNPSVNTVTLINGGTSEVAAARAELAAVATAADLVATNQDTIDTASDRVQTSLDLVATHQDTLDTAADLVATNQDTIDTAADLVATNQDTIDTAADRVQTGLDRVDTNADVVLTHADAAQTALDVIDTGADATQTGLDVVATNADVVLTHADRVQTNLDAAATASDLINTNADVVITHADVILAEADRVQTGLDRIAVAADLVLTNQDTIDTAADLVLTNADVITANNARTASETAQTAAELAETNAELAKSHAETAEAAALVSEGNASDSEDAALISENNAAASAVESASSAAAALVSEGVTHADVILTHADAVLAEADKVQTGLDRIAVAANLVLTDADTTATAADLVATNQDTIDTAADVVLTHADVILTGLDVVAASGYADDSASSAVDAAASAAELAGAVAAIDLNTAKVTDLVHPLVEKAVPLNAVFTDTVYDDTAIQAEIDLKADKPTTDAYLLGQPGDLGFGCAAAYPAQYTYAGCIPLPDHDVISSPSYGNYLHLASGAIMVYIPKHYFKITGNTFEYSDTAATGFVLDRSFINASVELNGVFISKYGGTNNNGVFSSQPLQDPLSSHIDHNPIGSLNGTPVNNYGGLYTAVKTMSSQSVLMPIFHYSMLARMAKAHGEAATNTSICAYIDVDPKMPKGCLISALRDVNDSSVTYTGSGYSACGLTGSGRPFAKTTHNGQGCGIADLNGNMWELASGFIRYDATGFLVLKESTDLTAITSDSTATGGGGAYDRDLYDVIDISDLVSADDGWTYLGNGSNHVFGFSATRTDAAYKRTAVGVPIADGVSAVGTTEFGNDGIYRYLRNEMACLCGGSWGSSSSAGVFAMYLNGYRTNSATAVDGRASILV